MGRFEWCTDKNRYLILGFVYHYLGVYKLNTLEKIYDNTRLLIQYCEEAGLLEEKKILQESMTTSFTFGEIICDIGSAIDSLLKEKEKYSKEFISLGKATLKMIKHFR